MNDIKENLFKSLKIAVAALAAIAVAGEIGLSYSATAGIITILSIQNTKRETIKTARSRILAFLCALGISFFCFLAGGFTLLSFSVYLLLFAMLCLMAGWPEAIAMDAVLITHFLTEGSMELSLIINESLLLIIGTGFGILVNLHLHQQQEEYLRLATEADNQIKGILHRMAYWLRQEDRTAYQDDCFTRLEQSLKEAKLCAAANYGNTIQHSSTEELDYIRMREQQSVVLKGIYCNIKEIRILPQQAEQIALLLEQIEKDYHRENTVVGLLEKLEMLQQRMKEQELPKCREEFEARAILFYIIMQLNTLLQLKRKYILQQKEAPYGDFPETDRDPEAGNYMQ